MPVGTAYARWLLNTVRDISRMEMVVVGNVTFTDRPAGPDRAAFVGTLDQIMDDVQTAEEAGADELIVDLNLQDWFTSTRQMLETAVEIRERHPVAGSVGTVTPAMNGPNTFCDAERLPPRNGRHRRRHIRSGVSGRPQHRPGSRCPAARFLRAAQRCRQRLHRAADVSDGRRRQRDDHRDPSRWRDGDHPCGTGRCVPEVGGIRRCTAGPDSTMGRHHRQRGQPQRRLVRSQLVRQCQGQGVPAEDPQRPGQPSFRPTSWSSGSRPTTTSRTRSGSISIQPAP